MSMKNVLVFYDSVYTSINTVYDYVAAFKSYSRHNICYCDVARNAVLFADLSFFDAVLLTYAVSANARFGFIHPKTIEALAAYCGLKIVIIQDEYESVYKIRNFLETIDADLLVSSVPEGGWETVYGCPGLKDLDFMNALTGYVPESLMTGKKFRPLEERSWDIGYRGRPLHYKYGRLGQEKTIIAKRMLEICNAKKIPHNIAYTEEERIYGDAWPEFIQDCRVMLGTESGANVFDFDGTLGRDIDAFLGKNPEADFEQVHAQFMKNLEGQVVMNQISPRVFECIALGTALLNFEGHYSGVIEPWKHYIPLKKDFSNIDEVIEAVSNLSLLKQLINNAYDDVVASEKYGYNTIIDRLDNYIDAHVTQCKKYELIFTSANAIKYNSGSGKNETMIRVNNRNECDIAKLSLIESDALGTVTKGIKKRYVPPSTVTPVTWDYIISIAGLRVTTDMRAFRQHIRIPYRNKIARFLKRSSLITKVVKRVRLLLFRR